ncbi:hypothetical protein JCM17960_27440 [Magnetospira thiophila]
MGQHRYQVRYTTEESRPQVERILQGRCKGSWELEEERRRRRSRRQEAHDFMVRFEQEDDILALLRSTSNAC